MRLNTITIHRAGVELHFLRQEVRHDPKGVSFVIGQSLPVVFKAFKNDVLIALPLPKTERATSERTAAELALAEGEFIWIPPPAPSLLPEGPGIEKVGGQNTHTPGTQSRRIEPLVHNTDGQGVENLYCLDRLVIRNPRGQVLGIHDGLVCEPDILPIKDVAIVEFDMGPQMKNNYGIMFRRW